MQINENRNSFFDNQHVQKAKEHSMMIDQKHWVSPEIIRALLARLGIDYNLVCRYLADSATIRDGFFVSYFCLEDVIALIEKISLSKSGKAHSLKLPYRHDKRAEGYVSTANYDS